jgi:hypothetical protein
MDTIEGFVDKYVKLENKRIEDTRNETTKKSCWIDWDRYAKDYSKKYLKMYKDFSEFFDDYFITKDKNRKFTIEDKIQKVIETDGIIQKSDGTTEQIGILQGINGKVIHGDHIKPHSKGGPTTIDNLQLMTREDNLKKSNS